MLARSLAICVVSGVLSCAAPVRADQPLFDLSKGVDAAKMAAQDAKATVSNGVLQLETGQKAREPGVTLQASDGQWDLSAFQEVAVEVKNAGAQAAWFFCRLDCPNLDGSLNNMAQSVKLAPGEKKTLRVALPRRFDREFRDKFFGMRAAPTQVSIQNFDSAKVTQITLYTARPTEDRRFEISSIAACGDGGKALAEQQAKFFPLIDQFGQYLHKDWPGKIKSLDDFACEIKQEDADLAAHPGPQDWDKYGGWENGPKLEGAGFFRTEKVNGKWWLVDPQGRLFWSEGVTCVRAGNGTTPISDRKNWFADLPQPNTPAGKFYGSSGWGVHNYYEGKKYETYDFSCANLLRKYGEGWRTVYFPRAQQRLRSWGINTIGNWSDRDLRLLRKTPYTETIGTGSAKRIEGSQGFWGQFPDPYDPDLPGDLHKQMLAHRGKTANDPWCIGFFVDNELGWGGDGVSLALATLASPVDQPAKQVFVNSLRRKYHTIGKLNAVWDTDHASWDALLRAKTPPDKRKARADLEAFYTLLAKRYFNVCRTAVKKVAPRQLYLGCRFGTMWYSQAAVQAAAQYCDVISFNIYKRTCDIRMPADVDKPIIIGEFHFGALDRGLFHPGLNATSSQAERARSYKKFVEGALEDPAIVGVHWFEYMDEATTGRGDGENFQIGFVDVCDTPYVETVQAARELGAELYSRRKGK